MAYPVQIASRHTMQTIGKYVVVREIGRGGMGVVYEARDPALDRPVALKLVNDRADPKRFLIEAKAAARVIHPNLVPIFDLGEYDGRPFLVMELVNGISASEFLARRGALRWKTATRVVAAACRGLAAIHAAGMVHRDIKPSNLLISKAGVVKVADFGLARMLVKDGLSLTGEQLVGTPHYMSPEQCYSEAVDARSDVYALGVTYFVLLTGRPPYHAEHELQIMFAHCNEPVPDPRTVVGAVPTVCAEVVRKAMAKSPADRYQSAREMHAALEPVLAADHTEELAALPGDDTPSPGKPDAETRKGPTPPTTGDWQEPGERGDPTPHGRDAKTPASLPRPEAPRTPDELQRPTRRRWLLAIPPAVAALAAGGYFAFRDRKPEDGAGVSPPPVPPPPPPVLVHVRNVGGTVRALAVSDDRRWLAVGLGESPDQPNKKLFGVKLYDRSLGDAPEVWWKWPDADCWGVAFSPDGKLLAAAGGERGEVLVWSLADQKPVHFASATFRGSVVSVAFSPNGKLLGVGVDMGMDKENVLQPGIVRVWEVDSLAELYDLVRDNHPVRKISFASDGKTLAASMSHGAVNEPRCEVWDASTGSHVAKLEAPLTSGGPSIAFARSTMLLAVSARDETTLYRPPSAEALPVRLRHHERPGAVALSPDGSLLALAVSEVISLWDTSNGTQRGTLEEHKKPIYALALTTDGRTLISGGEDGTVREYSLPTPT